MTDCISRQAAIELCDWYEHEFSEVDSYFELFGKELKAIPSADVVEVVRCKDCKFYDGRPCGIVDWYNTADDFCSRAERRTDGVDC